MGRSLPPHSVKCRPDISPDLMRFPGLMCMIPDRFLFTITSKNCLFSKFYFLLEYHIFPLTNFERNIWQTFRHNLHGDVSQKTFRSPWDCKSGPGYSKPSIPPWTSIPMSLTRTNLPPAKPCTGGWKSDGTNKRTDR